MALLPMMHHCTHACSMHAMPSRPDFPPEVLTVVHVYFVIGPQRQPDCPSVYLRHFIG